MSYSEHRYQSADGLSLYYRNYGASEDVIVCLPGMTRNSKDFEDLAEHLAGREQRPWRVISPDLRGRGRSDHDPNPANYHPGTYAGDTWLLLDGIGVQRAALIGTSLGGLVSLIMAGQQPARLRGIVLNDMGPEVPPASAARILEYVGRTPAAADWQAAAALARTQHGLAFPGVPDDFWPDYARRFWVENAEGKLVPDMDPAIGDALRAAYGAAYAQHGPRRGDRVDRQAGTPIDAWAAFDAVTMPCLLIQGALSDVLTDEIVERMRARKPHFEFLQVPDRGHAPLLNEPAALAAIGSFLAGLP